VGTLLGAIALLGTFWMSSRNNAKADLAASATSTAAAPPKLITLPVTRTPKPFPSAKENVVGEHTAVPTPTSKMAALPGTQIVARHDTQPAAIAMATAAKSVPKATPVSHKAKPPPAQLPFGASDLTF
jgi:hypothetical protein